jgi:hypothetical protein
MGEAHPGDRFGRIGRHGELILDTSAARLLNEIRAEIKCLSNLTGVPPVSVAEDGSGRRISINVTEPIVALLSGSSGPYSFTEQSWTGSAWATLPGGRTGTNAYEVNGITGLGGKVVRLRKTLVDDWRFQYVRLGAAPAAPSCGRICIQPASNCTPFPAISGATVTVTSKQVVSIAVTAGGTGFTSAPAVAFGGGVGSGATAVAVVSGGVVTAVNVTAGGNFTSTPTVTFSGGGGTGAAATATMSGDTTIGTCTSTGQVSAINKTANGSGYTSPPTITISGGGGSGATATCVLVFGQVGAITITNGGSGYTSNPTVSFSGGGGSGAVATATIAVQCCVPITAAGSYNQTVSAGGFTTKTVASGAIPCTGSSVTTGTTRIDPASASLGVCVGSPCLSPTGTGGYCGPSPGVQGVPGATVTLTGTSSTSGTTDGLGGAIPGRWASPAIPTGPYTATASHPRFTDTPSVSMTLAACGTETLVLFTTIAPGYACSKGTGNTTSCALPVATTLTLTDGVFGTQSLTYMNVMTTFGGPGWYGTKTVSFGGCASPGCTAGASGVKLEYGFNGVTIQLAWSSDSANCPCQSGATGCTNAHSTGTVTLAITCPPAFLATGTYSPVSKDLYCAATAFSIVE